MLVDAAKICLDPPRSVVSSVCSVTVAKYPLIPDIELPKDTSPTLAVLLFLILDTYLPSFSVKPALCIGGVNAAGNSFPKLS